MRNYLKVLMVVGLLALMLPLLFGYILGPVGAANTTIVKDHQNSKSAASYTCVGCHNPNSIDPNNATYPGAHRRHYVSAFLNFGATNPDIESGCGDCHEETVYGGGTGDGLGSGYEGDLSYTTADETSAAPAQWARSANKSVKADVCELCHGQFLGAGSGVAAGHTGVTLASDCLGGGCHSGGGTGKIPADVHDAATFVVQDYANSKTFCVKCHGENAWYETFESSSALSNSLPQ